MLLVLSLDFMIPGSRQVVYDLLAGGSHSYASMQLLVSQGLVRILSFDVFFGVRRLSWESGLDFSLRHRLIEYGVISTVSCSFRFWVCLVPRKGVKKVL
jgi:hypothetical protein